MSALRSLAGLAVLLGAVAAGAGACQLVAGLDGDFTAAPQPDGGAGGAGGGAPGCLAATYPDPPTVPDDAISTEFVIALRTIDLGEGAMTPPGYDLDHVCTCFADAGPSCESTIAHCDGPGGVDNATSQFFTLIQVALGASSFSSAKFSADVESGVWSLLARVRGYNGMPDDPAVEVALFPSPGTGTPPLWDGNDAWAVSAQSVDGGDLEQPVYGSAGAYVANGVLVAAMPTILMKLGGEEDTITFRLTGGVLTGHLAPQGSGYGLTGGIIAARWKIDDVFAALSTYRDGKGEPFCTDLVFAYDTAKKTLCNGRDILADSAGPRSQPCDALSIGVGFTAHAAQLGAVSPPPMPTPGCPPETDPANDSCN